MLAADITALRQRLRMPRPAFGAVFGIPVATLRDWEQGRRRPDRTALAYLRAISGDAEAVKRARRAGAPLGAAPEPRKAPAAAQGAKSAAPPRLPPEAPARIQASPLARGQAQVQAPAGPAAATPGPRAPAVAARGDARDPAPTRPAALTSARIDPRVEQIMADIERQRVAAERPKLKASGAAIACPPIRV